MPLLVDYYSVHDPVTGRIGFAPHSTSTKGNLKRGELPSKEKFITRDGSDKIYSVFFDASLYTFMISLIPIAYWFWKYEPVWY